MSLPNPYSPAPTPLPGTSRSSALRTQLKTHFGTGLFYAIAYVVVIWAVHLINAALGGLPTYFGIHPLDLSSIWHIFTSPLLHANWEHLISNTVPGAIFCFLIGLSGHRVFWEVTTIVMLLAGVGTWIFGGIGTNHIGASGMVYGWLAYLLIRGIFNRSISQIILGVLLGMAYSGFIYGVLPGTPGISWQAHLFGALGGLGAGSFITSDDPKALKEKRVQKALRSQRR
ncbi:Rhomboid family protein [Corynebacterium occultum]|uniref:Rhomboid family protein n=1 Tax=Corynebacterium occultum TaxID=2675219 RepID=A0A6B8W3N6_9CORY|nr:rhomboid family intramembrane serine protease [Corynebacterium occultum]QGU08154.1 Rhomboid family protein [Corynebacterium occultum]